jgi:hypothetical protein
MTTVRQTLVALTFVAFLTACQLVPLQPVTSIDLEGERVPLRVAYWVPPEFKELSPIFFMLTQSAGCRVGRTCVNEQKIFPLGIAAVAGAVFAESREVSSLEAGFDAADLDAVLEPKFDAIAVHNFSQPLMIRILWRVWAKDRSLVWVDTITSTVERYGMTRNGRARAINHLVREQFAQAAAAMRVGRWWEGSALRMPVGVPSDLQ